MKRSFSFPLLMGLLILATGILAVVSLLIGPADVSPLRALTALFYEDGAISLVMREIRLPRAILGVSIGISLGLSGAALQGYLRNPLAEGGILGIGSSAALGAVLAIYTGFAVVFPLALPLFALTGAFLSVVILFALSGSSYGGSLTLVLAGIAVSSLAAAFTSLVLNLASNPFASYEMVFWMLGSLADRSMLHVELALPFMMLGWITIGFSAPALDALSLGSDTAASLGVKLSRVRMLVIMGAAASIGAATAVAGSISFVGLVAPHMLRPFVGSRPGRLLPASAFGGAIILTAADIVSRLVAPDRDLKLGVVTALVGAPFFLWLVFRSDRKLS